MPKAAVALGSNLGDREAHLKRAIDQLGSVGRVVAVSGLYDTEPVGYVDQPRFLNGALVLDTELKPRDLLDKLLEIERSLGRDRTGVVAKGPRVVDLDLLLYEDRVIEEPGLIVPHPAMQERRFVLEPLVEIAPDWVHPVLRKTVVELLEIL